MNEKKPTQSIFLYDIAGAIIVTFCLAPLISVTWNAIVLFAFFALTKNLKAIGLRRLLLGVVVISIGGALIDWFVYIAPTSAYIEHISTEYATNFFATHPKGIPLPRIPYPPFIGLYFMPLVILCLGLFNLLLGRLFFNLSWQKSAILGITMGFLTAPWLVYLTSYNY